MIMMIIRKIIRVLFGWCVCFFVVMLNKFFDFGGY